jgi:oligopeptide transport system substrate-binding protein
MMPRPLSTGLCATVLLLSGTAIAAAQSMLMRGNDTDPATLDHHRTSTVAEANLIRDLYEGLVVIAPDGETVPGVAESWEQSEDGLTYTFTLREDARWSNGDPVTAGDFVFAYRRIMDPATAAGYASILFPIANAQAINAGDMAVEELGARAVDDRTLEITLANPTPYFLDLLTHQTGMPLHPPTVEEHGDQFTRAGTLVTNGAYMLESFTPERQDRPAEEPRVPRCRERRHRRDLLHPLRGPFGLPAPLRGGRGAHLLGRAGRADGLHAREPPRGAAHRAVSGRLLPAREDREGRPFRSARPAGDVDGHRPRLHRRSGLAGDDAARLFADPAGHRQLRGGCAAARLCRGRPLDREDDAIALLEEAGVSGLSVELRYNSSENHKNTMAAVADMLSNIGITASLVEMEGTNYFNYLREDGDFDLARAGWIGDYNDPQNFLYIFESDVSFNYPGWQNADYDALMRQAEQETDLQARAEILAEAERLFLDEVPGIPLMYYSSRALVSEEVGGWEDNVLNAHGTRFLTLSQ